MTVSKQLKFYSQNSDEITDKCESLLKLSKYHLILACLFNTFRSIVNYLIS